MPESMEGRGGNCWICHNGEEFTYLFEQESPGTEEESDESEESEEATPGPSTGTGSTVSDGPLYALEGSAALP